MFAYIWPIGLVVLSNVVYHICAKSVPDELNPFASLTITYAIGAIFSLLLFFFFSGGGNLIKEYSKLNWAPAALGIVIVGLEVGFIYVYKAGWQVSTASIVQSSLLSVLLIFVGWLGFHENITVKKIIGVAICMVGLVFINMK